MFDKLIKISSFLGSKFSPVGNFLYVSSCLLIAVSFGKTLYETFSRLMALLITEIGCVPASLLARKRIRTELVQKLFTRLEIKNTSSTRFNVKSDLHPVRSSV